MSEGIEKVRANFSKFMDYVVVLLKRVKDEEISSDIEKYGNEISKSHDGFSKLLQRVAMKQKHYFEIHEEIEERLKSSQGRTQEQDRSQSPRSGLILRSRGERGGNTNKTCQAMNRHESPSSLTQTKLDA